MSNKKDHLSNKKQERVLHQKGKWFSFEGVVYTYIAEHLAMFTLFKVPIVKFNEDLAPVQM